jgi:hypothetical protein
MTIAGSPASSPFPAVRRGSGRYEGWLPFGLDAPRDALGSKPLGFVAILGILALLGMIARNGVILIDERIRVLYWNGIHAACQHYNIDLKKLLEERWLFVGTRDQQPLCIAE